MSEGVLSTKVIRAVIAVGLLSFCGVVVETAMNITFSILMKTFTITTSTVQWMTTVYLLVVALVVPLSAYLKRSFRTKTLFCVANVLFSIGLLVDIIAPNFGLLLFGRVIQGVGVGIALPLMFNIILDQVPLHKIGIMMGIGTLITAVAPAVGPTFGGFVASSLGWRYIFVLLLPVIMFSFILGITAIEQKTEISFELPDMLSFLAILALFIGLILALSNLAQYAFYQPEVWVWFLLGGLGLFALIKRNQQLTQPIIALDVLKKPIFAGHVFAFFLFQTVNLGMSFLIPNYIQLVNHSSATIAGLLVFPAAFLGASCSPFSGYWLDRLGAKKPILFGTSLIVMALVFFSLFGSHLSNVCLTILYIVFMCGMGIAFGNIMTSGQKEIPDNMRSDANAIFNTLQQFAGAVGTTLASLIVAISQSQSSISQDLATAKGSQAAFAFLLVLAIVEWLVLYKVVANKPKTSS